MGRLAVVMLALGAHMAFGQLSHIDGFKINSDGYYEMSFKDVRDAIHKYNYVLDKNGSDTIGVVYNVTKNPIDFGFFSNDSESVIVSIFLRDGNKYKIIFTETDMNSDKYFFDVVDQDGIETSLYYRVR
jgi:hypothetical protein